MAIVSGLSHSFKTVLERPLSYTAMAALIVADKILALHPNHNRSKNWKKEVVLLTHGEQDEVRCTKDL